MLEEGREFIDTAQALLSTGVGVTDLVGLHDDADAGLVLVLLGTPAVAPGPDVQLPPVVFSIQQLATTIAQIMAHVEKAGRADEFRWRLDQAQPELRAWMSGQQPSLAICSACRGELHRGPDGKTIGGHQPDCPALGPRPLNEQGER